MTLSDLDKDSKFIIIITTKFYSVPMILPIYSFISVSCNVFLLSVLHKAFTVNIREKEVIFYSKYKGKRRSFFR